MPSHIIEEKAPSPLARIIELNPYLNRTDPRELPMKLRSLLSGPRYFFRGTADLFYEWCRIHCDDWFSDKGAVVLLHGDVHLGNVGAFRSVEPPPDEIGFGVVDLDEVIHGPLQLDLLRCLTALRMVANESHVDMPDEKWTQAAEAMCHNYVEALANGENLHRLRTTFATVGILWQASREGNPAQYVAKFCQPGSPLRFRRARMKKEKISDCLEPVDEARKGQVIDALWRYIAMTKEGRGPRLSCRTRDEFSASVQDVARWTRLVSCGSQGCEKYLVLVDQPFGPGSVPLILELKHEPAPAAKRAGALEAATDANRAKEMAQGYDQLLACPPWLIGWTTIGDRGYFVRSKDSWNTEMAQEEFKHSHEIRDAANILGAVVGDAHHQSLTALKIDPAGSIAVAEQRDILVKALIDRSGRFAEKSLHGYRALAVDKEAVELAKRADDFLQGVAAKDRG